MIRSSNFSSDDTAVNNILRELSSCFEATYTELLANVVHQPDFKQLRNLGEQQFFNATESNQTREEESKRIKSEFAEINKLAVSADDIIDAVISEKLQNNFLTKLKEEVLEIILKLYSDQDSSLQEKSKSAQLLQTVESPKENKAKNVKIVLEKLTDVGRYDSDLGNLSFDSVSSVHTSDLSSFNDEISISSDEETGGKRKLSLKLVEEEVLQIQAKKKKVEKNGETQVKSNKPTSLESPVLASDSSNTQQKSLPHRIRKPNSKYNSFGIVSPLRLICSEKAAQDKNSTSNQESEVANSLPRKRGRPRKIVS